MVVDPYYEILWRNDVDLTDCTVKWKKYAIEQYFWYKIFI